MLGILKRKKKRLGLLTPATVRLSEAPDRPIKVQILNISFGGACLHARQPLDGRLQVSIALGSKSEQADPEMIMGRVRWKRNLFGSSWLVGISFENLNSRLHPIITSYLDRNIKR